MSLLDDMKIKRLFQNRRVALPGSRGFTLLELMVVVVILTILTIVVVSSFRGHQRRARQTDAVNMLGKIKFRQEEFFAVYSRYESSTTDEQNFDGTKLHSSLFGYYRWEINCDAQPDNAWCRIGFEPDVMSAGGESKLLYFQLQTIGWSSATKNTPPSFVSNTGKRWLTMQARGLPTEEGNLCSLVRMTNESKEVMTFGTYNDCD